MSALLVAGTTSDAGKSLVTAGICRLLARQGIRVAPFKSQNMSNNSMVCADGAEIGRAQWLQAIAARAAPEAAMNPVLLKPGSDRRSHIVLMGQPFGTLEAGEFATGRRHLAAASFGAFRDLSSRYDVVVAEGAGSPAEVNLRGGDYVNMGLAREFSLPVVVVGDIDRGGVLAAMYGTLALLDPEDRALVRGWIVNKFRGSLELLEPGLDELAARTGLPVLGVVPWLTDVWLDSEDTLAAGGWSSAPGALRVAAVRLPRISNATDVDALAAEPGVEVTFTDRAADIADADLVVLPGSRATMSDLAWLRSRGLDQVIAGRVHAGRPVLGICGGHQMLAETISDPWSVEAGGAASGLGLLPTSVTFQQAKVRGTPTGAWRGHPVAAYEIHHGVSRLLPGAEAEPFLDGWWSGAVFGTTWHGAFENDGFRREFLATVAAAAGSSWTAVAGAPSYADRRELMLDRLADALEESVGVDTLLRVIDGSGIEVAAPRARDRLTLPAPSDLLHHGDAEVEPGMTDFAVNTHDTRPPDFLRTAITAAVDALARYPDVGAARRAIAAAHGVPDESVLLTAGAAEAFTLLAQQPWAQPTVVHPQFTEPEAALIAAGHRVDRLLLHGSTGFALDGTSAPGADLVVVGNPTNPTSRLHDPDEVAGLGRLVAVDEAFMDAVEDVGHPAYSLARRAANDRSLLVIRSLTKTYSIAGVRIGYVIGHPDLLEQLTRRRPLWPVSSLAAAAVVACLSDEGREYAADVRASLPGRLSHLSDGLRTAGFTVPAEPRGPFVLARHPGAATIRRSLRTQGIAVRRGDTFPGLDGQWLRFAARDKQTSDRLLTALPR